MKNELISEFQWNRKSSKIDKYVKKIFNDTDFQFDPYENKYIGDKLIQIETNKLKWTNEYFLEHITLLYANFSKERLLHCLDLREHIDGVKLRKSTNGLLYIGIAVALAGTIAISYYILSNKQQIQSKDTNVTNITK